MLDNNGDVRAAQVVLVVEDEPLIALELITCLEAELFVVLGPASTVKQALALLASRSDVHAAIVDVKLKDGTSEDVWRELQERNIPFIVTSGYLEGTGSELAGQIRVQKPYPIDDVVAKLRILLTN